jgi:hypothetical protein
LARILDSKDRLAALKTGALERARKYTHEQRVLDMVERFYKPMPEARAVI